MSETINGSLAADWESALAFSSAATNFYDLPPDFAVTIPLRTDEGDLELITEDTVLAFADAIGHNWNRLRSNFATIATSWDSDVNGHNAFTWPYINRKGAAASFVAITPDKLAYVLAKHGRYGVSRAGEQTVSLLADMLAFYSIQKLQESTN